MPEEGTIRSIDIQTYSSPAAGVMIFNFGRFDGHVHKYDVGFGGLGGHSKLLTLENYCQLSDKNVTYLK